MSSNSPRPGSSADSPDGADEGSLGYKPPAEKSLDSILKSDAEDEALKKYKEALLGQAVGGDAIVVEKDNPNNVIVKKLALVVEGRDDMVLDLTKNLKEIKKQVCSIYSVKIAQMLVDVNSF